MEKRKRFILHKIQAKTTYTVMGILFLGIAIILSVIALVVTSNHRQLSDINRKNALIVHRIDNITAIQDNVIEDILTYSNLVTDPKQRLAIDEFAMDHYNNMSTLKKNITDTQQNINAVNNIIAGSSIMLVIIIAIVFIQGIALYLMGVRIGNRITGPLMIISRFLREYIDGRAPELRPIRKDDELQEFYSLFAEAVEKVRREQTASR